MFRLSTKQIDALHNALSGEPYDKSFQAMVTKFARTLYAADSREAFIQKNKIKEVAGEELYTEEGPCCWARLEADKERGVRYVLCGRTPTRHTRIGNDGEKKYACEHHDIGWV